MRDNAIIYVEHHVRAVYKINALHAYELYYDLLSSKVCPFTAVLT